jgi:hypothetical protein
VTPWAFRQAAILVRLAPDPDAEPEEVAEAAEPLDPADPAELVELVLALEPQAARHSATSPAVSVSAGSRRTRK